MAAHARRRAISRSRPLPRQESREIGRQARGDVRSRRPGLAIMTTSASLNGFGWWPTERHFFEQAADVRPNDMPYGFKKVNGDII
ncbi:hypothetical protein FOMG_18346 [Fusarium oxysporum f. sp. melonis 26406]|uniref:Uncharacterized protein n=1 Tax=Fusarium oxysporum f. sp. melonis 26406 TaxID=1089452 RepID=W9Z8L5_FUSOX|nr:hypothetical protein FOMG_18346 [Fusarium oxysporum f. sp. melonis 26406]